MELTIERDAFIKILGKVQGIVEKRNAMPILSNTLLRASDQSLEILATDLEATVIDTCPVDLSEEGSVTLNAKKLFEIVKEMPDGPLFLKSDDEYHVEVKSGKVRYEIMGMSSDDYPKIPDPSDFSFISVPGPLLYEMIHKTIYATAGEEARFSLNGVLFEKTEEGEGVRMVATDGHRLAKIERMIEGAGNIAVEKQVILPRKGMSESMKLLDGVENEVGLAIKEKQAAVKIGDTVLIMRLVDGKFPDYRKVIIEGCDQKATASKEELIRNLRRASLMVDDKARAVKFEFTPGNLRLESKNINGSSSSELDIDYDGDKMSIGFNDRYFVDIMNATKSEKIEINLRDEQSPALVTIPDEENYVCVIMPMRL